MTEPASGQKKVLVVDDDIGILEAMRFMLESSGYSVQTMPRGDEVISSAAAYKPDVILLDLYLSGFDGRDIAAGLRKSSETSGIPIIMISAHPSAGDALKKTDIDEFLPKPFDVSQLLSVIERQCFRKAEAKI